MYIIPRMCSWHGGIQGYVEHSKKLPIEDLTDGFCPDCSNRYIKIKEKLTDKAINYARFNRDKYLVNRVRVNKIMMERKKLYPWEVIK